MSLLGLFKGNSTEEILEEIERYIFKLRKIAKIKVAFPRVEQVISHYCKAPEKGVIFRFMSPSPISIISASVFVDAGKGTAIPVELSIGDKLHAYNLSEGRNSIKLNLGLSPMTKVILQTATETPAGFWVSLLVHVPTKTSMMEEVIDVEGIRSNIEGGIARRIKNKQLGRT